METKDFDIKKFVEEYSTKHEIGFTKKEIDDVLKIFPNINKSKFNNALNGITCQVVDGETVIYHCDIELALRCGIEDRNPGVFEWD